jgi:Helix-turn-helix
MKDYRSAKKRITVSVGESVRILRELQELSQSQLARLTGIPQTTISAIENDRVRLGGGCPTKRRHNTLHFLFSAILPFLWPWCKCNHPVRPLRFFQSVMVMACAGSRVGTMFVPTCLGSELAWAKYCLPTLRYCSRV